MAWLPFERRWRDVVVASMLPGIAPPDPSFWTRFDAAAPWLLRVGFRAAVWALTWSPPWWIGRWRTLPRLDAEERDLVVAAAVAHPGLPVRLLMTATRLVVAQATLGSRPMSERR